MTSHPLAVIVTELERFARELDRERFGIAELGLQALWDRAKSEAE